MKTGRKPKAELVNFYSNAGTTRRVDAIVEKQNENGWGLTRSHVMRQALHRGLEALEKGMETPAASGEGA